MYKAIKVIAIVIGGILVALAGKCVYMILCISCTFPPIKEYQYQGSIDQLGRSIQKFTLSNPGVTYKFSRRDSSARVDNGDRDLVIGIKKDTSIISYEFVCEGSKNKTELKLVGAHGRNDAYGGYTINAPGVKDLLNNFENSFLVRLEREEHVILKPE